MTLRPTLRAGLAGLIVLDLLVLAAPAGTRAGTAAGPTRKSPAAAKPTTAPGWQYFSDANAVHGLAVHAGRLYAATGGGVVAWDLATGKVLKKWTALDGLLGNRADAIAVCPLPEPKLVVGTLEGFNVCDLKTGRWQSLTPASSEMAGASVTALVADPERKTLYIGYGYAGVN